MRVLETFASSNAFPAFGFDQTIVITSQICNRLLNDVVLNRKIVCDPCSAERGFYNVFGCLNLSRKWIEVVLSIEIEVDAMISEGFHVGLAARRSIALRVWWAHIRGIFADYVGEGSLVLDHLLLSHV